MRAANEASIYIVHLQGGQNQNGSEPTESAFQALSKWRTLYTQVGRTETAACLIGRAREGTPTVMPEGKCDPFQCSIAEP